MDMKQAIQRVADRQDLTGEEAGEVMELLLTGAATQAQIGAFLTGLRMKGETIDEIAGLVSGGSQLGYTPSGMSNGFELSTLFPDYSMSGLPEWTGYILSAIVGVALLVIIFKIISSMMKEKVDFKKKAA